MSNGELPDWVLFKLMRIIPVFRRLSSLCVDWPCGWGIPRMQWRRSRGRGWLRLSPRTGTGKSSPRSHPEMTDTVKKRYNFSSFFPIPSFSSAFQQFLIRQLSAISFICDLVNQTNFRLLSKTYLPLNEIGIVYLWCVFGVMIYILVSSSWLDWNTSELLVGLFTQWTIFSCISHRQQVTSLFRSQGQHSPLALTSSTLYSKHCSLVNAVLQ